MADLFRHVGWFRFTGGFIFVLFLFHHCFLQCCECMRTGNHLVDRVESPVPLVINTWHFNEAAQSAWNVLYEKNGTVLDAVVAGCSRCEDLQCDGTVGYGGSPDESGETTLDAMVMYGPTHDVGAVADLRRVKSAIAVARAVMEFTEETFLVGESASKFAVEMGFKEESLRTNHSIEMYKQWVRKNCQPNFRKNVLPDPKQSCGPYKPHGYRGEDRLRYNREVSKTNHDTIGMIAIDARGDIAAGTSTNGANHKVPGRVGDSPVPGAGAYVDNDVGGAAATGDGDTMMRFLPSYQVVESMRGGMDPQDAAQNALKRITRFYPNFSGAIVAVNKTGAFGAACHGFTSFQYCVGNPSFKTVRVFSLDCSR